MSAITFQQGQLLTAAELNAAFGTIYPVLNLPENDIGPALTLTTPYSTTLGAASPLAALHIQANVTPPATNFTSGLWVETNAATQNIGRGIIITNTGQSDSLYIQNTGANASGIAVLLQTTATNTTGIVIGTLQAGQNGMVIRQETELAPGACVNLLSLQALGSTYPSSATQMLSIASDAAGQQGIIAVLTGSGSTAANLTNNGTVISGLDTSGGALSYLFAAKNAGASVNAGLKIAASSAGVVFEGTDSTGLASYQPLYVGGSAVLLQVSGTTALEFASVGLMQLPGYTTAGVLVNDGSGNVTTASAIATATTPGNFSANRRLPVSIGGTTYYIALDTATW